MGGGEKPTIVALVAWIGILLACAKIGTRAACSDWVQVEAGVDLCVGFT